mmetsp:Transcript_7874/g.12838  ORF Transcript_7874/g.12838 Transcript_7874/m.12838 type:complete len:293 (-) Transcript_7874:243-1121(-)
MASAVSVWIRSLIMCFSVRIMAAKLTIELQPTGDFSAADWAGAMYFKVVNPVTTNLACSTTCDQCTVPGAGWATQTNCGGNISFNLSAHDELEFIFSAPSGYEVQIDGPERSRLEFQAKVPCGSGGSDAYKYQDLQGSTFTPVATGSNTSMLTYNPSSSFVTLGKCMGCSQCEVYTRVQYDGPIAQARFSSISWTVSYNQSNTIDKETYYYGTDLYCWIRGATLASRRLQEDDVESAPRELNAFSGNSYKLIAVSSTSTSPSTAGSGSGNVGGSSTQLLSFCVVVFVMLSSP